MIQVLGALVIAGGIYAVYRRVDVRLALLVTALVLGFLAGNPAAIALKFLETFSNERFVVPICTAMGFAYVLKLTECDRHLVHLLVRPLTRVRPLLVPGTILVAFLVNIPIVSQTSTAVTVGAVIIPILLAARIPPVTIGATLLLGSSIGGELLNPGAPELRTVVEESTREALKVGQQMPGTEVLVARILPLNLLGLAVGTAVCWGMSLRARPTEEAELPADLTPTFNINYFKALIPVLPLVLLFLTAPPFKLVNVPTRWLLERKQSDLDSLQQKQFAQATKLLSASGTAAAAGVAIAEPPLTPQERGLFDCRLIGAAMLIGVVVATLSAPRVGLQSARVFFEGAGYGFANIISLIVTATCLGKGVELIELNKPMGDLIAEFPVMLMPLAGALPMGFAALCGSGMASTQSLFAFFAEPSVQLGIDPFLVGAVVSLASGAGRTLSPFAAVTLMCATLTKTDAMKLSARVAAPLLAAVTVEVIAAMLMVAWGW